MSVIAAVLSAAVAAQDPEVQVAFRFQDAPIEDVIEYVKKTTGFIIVDKAKVSGKVTARSDTAIPKSQVLAFLDSCLAPNYGLVRFGNEVHILKFEDAKKRTLDVRVTGKPEDVPRSEQVLTVIYPLQNLNVVEVNKELQDLYPRNATVLVNTYANSLVITGRADEIHKLMLVISKLDVEAKERPVLRVIKLRNADATVTAKLINDLLIKEAEEARTNPLGRMFRMMAPGGGGGGVKAKEVASEVIRVSADTRTNSLIVAATAANIDLIVEMVRQLDEIAGSERVALYKLEYADAETVAALILDLFDPRRSQPQQNTQNQGRRQEMWWMGGGMPGGPQGAEAAAVQSDVRAVADLRTNTVVVTAAEKIHEGIIQPLVDELDKKSDDFQGFRCFRLRNADALETASQIRSLFEVGAAGQTTQTAGARGGARPGGTTPGATSVSRTGNVLAGQRVTVMADERTNSVLVRASPQQMEVIAEMVRQVDAQQSEDIQYYAYKVRNGDAVRLQQMISQMNQTGVAPTAGGQAPAGRQNPFSTIPKAGQTTGQGGMMNSQTQNTFGSSGRSSSRSGGFGGGSSFGGFRP